TTAIVTHFSLQRFFVWAHHGEFALSVRGQAGRYLVVSGTQYATTALATFVLPRVLLVPTTVVYVVWTIAFSTVNFFVFGRRVFHANLGRPPPTRAQAQRPATRPGRRSRLASRWLRCC